VTSSYESQNISEPTIPLSIISDSLLLREGLLNVLAGHMAFCLIGSYSGDALADTLPNPEHHIVLLDAGIGTDTALRRTHEWHERGAWVVLLELTEDIDLIVRCIEAGANAYALRGSTAAQLAETNSGVQRGMATCSPQVTARLFEYLALRHTSAEMAGRLVLTGRELEVLGLLSQSLTNQQIAESLSIELCTVKHHVHNILDKLNVRYRWEAVQYAQQRGWLHERAGMS
jgi:DNA-binding NarL/FixJ family response regulator